jgi:hypothetical protein
MTAAEIAVQFRLHPGGQYDESAQCRDDARLSLFDRSYQEEPTSLLTQYLVCRLRFETNPKTHERVLILLDSWSQERRKMKVAYRSERAEFCDDREALPKEQEFAS